MTTASAARHANGVLVGAEQPSGSWTGSLRQAWRTHLAYRATVSELAALTDRDLADIGMMRGDLKGIARRATYGK